MTQPIFIKHEAFSKTAGQEYPVGDDSSQWGQKVLVQAFQSLPFLSEFSVDVGIDKIDEEQGFGFGSLIVKPLSQRTPQEEGDSPLPVIHIPFIIRDGLLAPMDIYATPEGKFKPLSEQRLIEELDDPNYWDAPRDRPWEPNLFQELQPPLESSTGIGGGGVKLGSEILPLLPQLDGRISAGDLLNVKEAMEAREVRDLLADAPAGVASAFNSASRLGHTPLDKVAVAVQAEIPASVVQMSKTAGNTIKVKWANAEFYQPQEMEMDPITAREMSGNADIVPHLEEDGTITMSPDPVVKEEMHNDDVSVIQEFGLYNVQTGTGEEITGYVFPRVLTYGNEPLPLTLFTNGSQYAIQDGIAGKLVGKSTEVPKGQPRGYGCFYVLDHGTARAYEPMHIQRAYRGETGEWVFMGTTHTGEQVELCLADVKIPVAIGPGKYCIPDWWWWLPLRGPVELVRQPAMFQKVAEDSVAEVISDQDGLLYSLRGQPFEKVASSMITKDQAEFLLVAAGVQSDFVKEAMKRTLPGKVVKLGGLRQIQPFEEKVAEARIKVAQQIVESGLMGMKRIMVKEAAAMADTMSADALLSLGFLNPENISAFVDMIPSLEATACKLAETLMAARLGMSDVSEVALERSLHALDEVLTGLRRLEAKEVSY